MIKPELVQEIANKTRVSKKQIEQIMDVMLDTIISQVKDGEKVLISGFGTFHLTHRKARNGINPVTKEPMKIDGVMVPKFKAGEQFKRAVRSKK